MSAPFQGVGFNRDLPDLLIHSDFLTARRASIKSLLP